MLGGLQAQPVLARFCHHLPTSTLRYINAFLATCLQCTVSSLTAPVGEYLRWVTVKSDDKYYFYVLSHCVNCNCLWMLIGFWWLPGENLGHRWRPPFGNTPWPFSGNLWHGCQLREHSYCFSKLWQNHQSVVPADLCTHPCSAGPCCLHHIYSGENAPSAWAGSSAGEFQDLSEQIRWSSLFHTEVIGHSLLTPSIPVVLSCC